jgi:hypothetical protein
MTSVEPYGVQREACLVGTFDADGALVSNPMPRASFVFRIAGPLDPDRFTGALRTCARRNDVWRTRIRRTPDGDRLIQDADQDTEPMTVTCASTRDRDRLAELLSATAYAPIDLKAGPLAAAVVVETAPDEHVLLIRADHAWWDGFSIGAFLHRALLCYADGPVPDSGPGFGELAHAASVRDEERETARAFWADAMAEPVPPSRFPGGRAKRWPDVLATSVARFTLDPQAMAAVTAARGATGASRGRLLLAALCFVTALWTDRPLPVLYARGGRGDPRWHDVQGPLHEAVLAVGTGQPAPTLGAWAGAHAAANAAAPPLRGQWLTDFGGVEALRARRLFVLNQLPPALIQESVVGGLRVTPDGGELRDLLRPPPDHRGVPPHNGLHLMVHWVGEVLSISAYTDPEVLPDPAPVIAAIRRFWLALAETPEIEPARFAETLRRAWPA